MKNDTKTIRIEMDIPTMIAIGVIVSNICWVFAAKFGNTKEN